MQRIGRELAGSFPSPARHPLRSLDQKAMQLTSAGRGARRGAVSARRRDPRLPLGRRPELAPDRLPRPGRPSARLRSTPRCGSPATQPGARRSGAATAAGVRHMAHRFIVGESPREALATLSALWRDGIATSVDLLGEATVTTAEADRYAARCDEALETLSGAAPRWPRARVAGARLRGPGAAGQPLGQGHRADAADATAGARGRARGRRGADAAAAATRARPRRAPARRHGVGRLARDHRRARPRTARRAGVRRAAHRPASSCRPTCATRRLNSTGCSSGRAQTPRATPLVVRLVKGAYWDHEVVEARQHGWRPPVFEEQGRVRPQLRGR